METSCLDFVLEDTQVKLDITDILLEDLVNEVICFLKKDETEK